MIEILCATLLICITSIVFVQVISRYLLGVAHFWIEEFAREGMIWMTFYGAVLCVYKNAHTKIEYFVSKLPKPFDKIVIVITNLVCAAFSGSIAYYSIGVVQANMKMTLPALQIPSGIVTTAIPISMLFMVIGFILQAIKVFTESGKMKTSGGA
jgi:TRAP-type C4-dicarboxylate transport system permease small subunit